MIAGLLTGIAASPWVRAALRYGAIVLTVLLFLLALRRSGAPASEWDASPNALKPRRRPMTPNAGCWKRRLAVLAITTSLLTGCATGSSDSGGLGACPYVVEYSRAFQAQAAEELELLPEDKAIAELLADCAVMREQAQAYKRISGLPLSYRQN